MTTIQAFPVESRPGVGGGASRALRRTGHIPGVLYGGDKENVPLSIDVRHVVKGLNTPGFYTTIFELNVNGKKEQALVREVQVHPVTDQPVHVDFWRVSKGTKIHVNIPVHFINEEKSPGIKRGGVLNIVVHTLDVSCSPENIPEAITIDLAGLEIGASIHLDQIGLPKGVAATHPERDNTLATIVAPTVQKEVEETSTEEAAEGTSEEGGK